MSSSSSSYSLAQDKTEVTRHNQHHDKVASAAPFVDHQNNNDAELAHSLVYKSQVLDRELFLGIGTKPPEKDTVVVVAYVITITDCVPEEPLWDGAAVLGRTIMLNSKENPYSGSNYGAKLYAIIHESAAVDCARKYQRIGYEVIVKPSPVTKDQLIPGLTYFNANVEARCHSLKDYTILWAYTLTQHEIVVLVDVASYMIKPVDELFDAMLLDKDNGGTDARKKIAFHWPQMGQPGKTLVDYFIARTTDLPEKIDAFLTKDYTAITSINLAMTQRNGVMEEFMVIRPNITHFDELTSMIREGGNWTSREGGWYDEGKL
jgi:hypothetical protein